MSRELTDDQIFYVSELRPMQSMYTNEKFLELIGCILSELNDTNDRLHNKLSIIEEQIRLIES